MAATHTHLWRKLPMSLAELCIDTTLRCGQSFRWRKSEDGIWSCAIRGRILSLRQDSTHLHYRAVFLKSFYAPLTPPCSSPPSADDILKIDDDDDDTDALVQHYLNLSPNLTDYYEQWSCADLNFKKKAPKFAGIRILRQDAWEALIGFICSSNNNIARISQMMEKLCVHYGTLIGHLDSKAYYDMPSPSALVGPNVEAHLRQLGFGYRAKYLSQTAKMVSQEHPIGWLDSLRNPESPLLDYKPVYGGEMQPGGRIGYRKAHEDLLALQGVGPKVADCVCLMGLGWGEAVPVDTHVWQIAQRDYKFGKGKHRSLTKATYDAVGNHFRDLWGKEAGWAHSVLFAADLKAFAERLSTKVDIKEIVVKEEDDSTTVRSHVKAEILKKNRVKREFEENEKPETGMGTRSTTKRRRKR